MSSCIRVRAWLQRCQAEQRRHEHSQTVGDSALSMPEGGELSSQTSTQLPLAHIQRQLPKAQELREDQQEKPQSQAVHTGTKWQKDS